MANTKFEQLYEIGCGGGQVLEYLGQRLTDLEHLTGIDLGEKQIAQNRETYNHPKLAFEAADASEWLPQHASETVSS